jgi:hypothetical protein
MEPEGSLLYSQEPATGPYPEPDESTPTTYYCFQYLFDTFISKKNKLQKKPGI